MAGGTSDLPTRAEPRKGAESNLLVPSLLVEVVIALAAITAFA